MKRVSRMSLPRSYKTRAGLTIVELLIAGLVLVIVLGLGGAFLAQQMTLQRAVQARSQVQDRVRVLMQVVTQDLSLAGNSMLVDADGAIVRGVAGLCRNVEAPNSAESCFRLGKDEPAGRSRIFTRYLSSQFPGGLECRDVSYYVNGSDLVRSDVPCGDDEEPVAFGAATLVFDVLLVCGGGTVLDVFGSVNDCGDGYPRSAIVTIASASDIHTRSEASSLAFTDVDGVRQPIDCEANTVCFVLSQEVLMPNLKDR